jgi:hypothetical protein
VESIPERVCHASIIGDPAPLDGERGRATMFAYAGDTPRWHGKSALLPLSLSPSCSLRRGDPCSSFRAHLTALTTWSVCALQGECDLSTEPASLVVSVWLSSVVVRRDWNFLGNAGRKHQGSFILTEVLAAFLTKFQFRLTTKLDNQTNVR